jgi:glycosyltransferase involved in cell wall biosynthesis
MRKQFCYKLNLFFSFLFISFQLFAVAYEAKKEKVVICGVVKNVGFAFPKAVKNIEELGNQFANYAVIIYENNSTDNTVDLFSQWAQKNNRVIFQHENVPIEELNSLSRTEKIARARNIVLKVAQEKYHDYNFLIMVDLDLDNDWSISEIVSTLESNREWDCVSANGVLPDTNNYYDTYPFLDEKYPLGPELIGNFFCREIIKNPVSFSGDEWAPTFSSFGGLAIYKMASLKNSYYSGTVTKDLTVYYKKILLKVPVSNIFVDFYIKTNLLDYSSQSWFSSKSVVNASQIPIIFKANTIWDDPLNIIKLTCCEHKTFHASMALKGHDKFFINPKIKMIQSSR